MLNNYGINLDKIKEAVMLLKANSKLDNPSDMYLSVKYDFTSPIVTIVTSEAQPANLEHGENTLLFGFIFLPSGSTMTMQNIARHVYNHINGFASACYGNVPLADMLRLTNDDCVKWRTYFERFYPALVPKTEEA